MKSDEKHFMKSQTGLAIEYRITLAWDLIKTYGLIAGSSDQKTLTPPREVVSRTFAIVDEFYKTGLDRGYFLSSAETEGRGFVQLPENSIMLIRGEIENGKLQVRCDLHDYVNQLAKTMPFSQIETALRMAVKKSLDDNRVV